MALQNGWGTTRSKISSCIKICFIASGEEIEIIAENSIFRSKFQISKTSNPDFATHSEVRPKLNCAAG